MVRIMPGYRFYIHTLLLCLNLIWLSEAGLAQAPDPAKWLKEVREKGVTGDTGVVPNRVVMIRKIYKKKPPKLRKIKAHVFNRMGIMRTESNNGLKLAYSINQRPKDLLTKIQRRKLKKGKKKKIWRTDLFSLARADIVLQGNKEWDMYVLKDGEAEEVFTAKAPKKKNAKNLHKWLAENLGYGGFIIDRRGKYFLVGTLSRIRQKSLQGLIQADSAGKIRLTKEEKEGSKGKDLGLLQLVSHNREAGVFELVISGEKDIPLGSKVSLETKK